MAYEQKVWRHHGIGVLASSEILSYGVIFKKSRVALTSATFCRFWRGTGLHFVFPFQGNRQSQKAKRKKRRLRVSLMVAERSNTKWFLFLCHSKWAAEAAAATGDGCVLLQQAYKEQMALSKPLFFYCSFSCRWYHPLKMYYIVGAVVFFLTKWPTDYPWLTPTSTVN